MKKLKEKGIIPVWVAGLLSTILLAYGGTTSTVLFKHSDTNATQDSRISINETNIENMKEIMNEIKAGNEKIINILMEK